MGFLILTIFLIFVLCLLSAFAVIYNDVYDICKLKNKEEISIDLIKFEKCILPYKKTGKQ